MAQSGGRKGGPQRVLEVIESEPLSPSMVRIRLGGAGARQLIAGADPAKLAATDKYVKLVFADPSLGLEPPYDMERLREQLPVEKLPSRRTYTIRSVDAAAGTIAIDFVVHGDEGIAGPWARDARPGDLLVLSGPGGGFAPAPEACERRYFGDDSAIPAIAAAVEALPSDAVGVVIVEVEDGSHEQPMQAPSGVDVRWVHRSDPSRSSIAAGEALVSAVYELAAPTGPVEVFAHGEREAMKRLRPIIRGDWEVPVDRLSLSAYWAHGRTEDRFQAEKRTPVGEIPRD